MVVKRGPRNRELEVDGLLRARGGVRDGDGALIAGRGGHGDINADPERLELARLDLDRLGEGLPGQVALQRKMMCLNAVPPDYLPSTSALGKSDPLNVVIMPIMHNDTCVGVLELGSFRQFSADDFNFLHQSLEGVAIAIVVSRSHQRVSELLEQTQAQAEELLVQQEELQQTNEELEERARMLEALRKQHDQ